ncbi:hypothetical protein NQX30_07125 [Candidatus Persebacteraceae bacterium Df01]|jgi:hypothetical protein|uniref:Uncharacterized protein n=1 Tax=Candidatus Doriopsillibacter californiensis TaxID=2970740 RepID=A0ABT7QNA8_9GAMM|nr:hypothetical protein [Candidatus Persebacteraceae bacterium Df01]
MFKRSGLVLTVLLLTACADGTFSQHAGFENIHNTLSDMPPTVAEQALLARYRPILYVANGEEGPIDFYADYISNGELFSGNTLLIRNPDTTALNAVRHNPQAVFTHQPTVKTAMPVAYGGVYHATLQLDEKDVRELTFLSYHFAFRHSGLPAGLTNFGRVLANIFANARDWHQLDHYTAVFIALCENTPFAIILQQHNYMRTYFIGEDAAFPAGNAPQVNAAISSNELYPHRKEKTKRRAVGSIHAGNVDYLIGSETRAGFFTAPDITSGDRQVNYELQFLPPNDAFYVFKGRLGEHRRLPGRDGPPGAMYRTLPKLFPLEVALYAFYWQEGDTDYAQLLKKENLSKTGLRQLKKRFAKRWRELQKSTDRYRFIHDSKASNVANLQQKTNR